MERSELEGIDHLRGARILGSDLRGLEIRDCRVDGLRIVDSLAETISVSGALGRVLVDDVDVTDHVRAVLDERHPLRRQAREASTPEQFRHTWHALQDAWDATVEGVRRSPMDLAHAQVDGEWSMVQTLRHLRFAADAWLGAAILEEAAPHHPWGLPAGGTPEEFVRVRGLDLAAAPSLEEVLALRAERRAVLEAYLGSLTAEELARVCTSTPGPGYPDQEYVVARCLRVVLTEEAEHLRYVLRDLEALGHRAG